MLGDNGSTCASAYHGGGSPTGNELISITAPTDSIYDGNDITIALGVKPNGSSTKVGFMASVEDASGNQLATSSPGTGAKNVGDYITHTNSGTTVSNDSIFGRLMWTAQPFLIVLRFMLQLTSRMEMVKHGRLCIDHFKIILQGRRNAV